VLQQLSWRDGLLVMIISFVVRPVAVLLATLRAGMSWQERALISWIAPRGVVAAAVAGVFGTAMATHGYPEAERLVPIIFLLILTTVVLHGSTIGWVSRHLNLSSTQTNGILIVGCSPWSVALGQELLALKVPCLLADASWHRLRAARLAGIPVYYGEIMSERSEESLELIDMNYVLAATDNDAYNALVCMRFASEFGRHRVFQLPMLVEEKESKSMSRTSRGNVVFQENVLYEELIYRYFQGWRFQKTRFTDNYTYRDYWNEDTKERIPVLLIKASREIVFVTPTGALNPKTGDILLNFQLNNKNKTPQEIVAQKES
jgi:hypothetical protein